MSPLITRRNLMIGAAGTAGAMALGGGIWVGAADARTALLAYFKRALPGVTIDEPSARQCISEFLKRWSPAQQKVVATAWQTLGVEEMVRINDKFALAARWALTRFLTNSNFFDLDDPRSEPIVYESPEPGAACRNPFADLSPPAATPKSPT